MYFDLYNSDYGHWEGKDKPKKPVRPGIRRIAETSSPSIRVNDIYHNLVDGDKKYKIKREEEKYNTRYNFFKFFLWRFEWSHDFLLRLKNRGEARYEKAITKTQTEIDKVLIFKKKMAGELISTPNNNLTEQEQRELEKYMKGINEEG